MRVCKQSVVHTQLIFVVMLLLLTLTSCNTGSLGTSRGDGPDIPDSTSFASRNSSSGDSDTVESVPSSQILKTPNNQLGTIEHFLYGNLEVVVSNVSETRQETIQYADGSWEMEYSIFTCLPGAVITVLNADMSNPEYAEDQKAHPQWAIDTTSGTPINIVDEMEPIAVTPDYLGLYNKESSVYVLRFEVCVE